ncbi:MAG: hypothetical protein ACYTBP_01085 [Planctomycetota bacterium]
MSRIKGILLSGFVVSVVFAGCGKQEQKQAVERICVPGGNKTAVVLAAENVLREMRFDLAKSDIGAGYLRTRPLQGAQFFEFWRSDNKGEFNAAEANIQSIRRTAELKVAEEGGQVCIDCSVWTERLSLPERDVTSSTKAYEMFSRSNSSQQSLKLDEEQMEQMSWVSLGKDPMLAGEILGRLEGRLSQNKEK